MKKAILILLCAALCAGSICGCAVSDSGAYVATGDALEGATSATSATTADESDSAAQSISMCYYADAGFNPYTCTNFTNRALFSFLYQSLFNVDADYNVTPILCNAYSVSSDMKTYTLEIAPARFSDGTLLTVEDVMASLEAAEAGSYYSGRFLHVSSITQEGSRIVIKLDTPMENLPLLLDIPIVKASEVDSDQPLGTGPYQLESSISGLQLRRQSAWWCSADLPISATYIPLVAAESASYIRDQFEFADVNLVCTDPGSDTYADYRCDYEIWDCETGLFLYLVVSANCEALADDEVRQCLTYAIDRDSLCETYYHGFARSATLPASPQSPYYSETLAARYSYDPTRLSEILWDKNLYGAEVTLLLNSDDSLRLRAGRAIADMLEECGLEVTLLELGTTDYIARLRSGDYDLYLGQTKLSPNMDLTAFFKTNGSLSYGSLSDSAIYAMALEALTNSGNYYNLHEMVMEDAQLIPILFRSYAVYAERGLITGLNPSRDNLLYYNLGISLEDILTDFTQEATQGEE
ncbi:MAG: ABC transporter substrate-binding protein [Firmicutes bacterium]|nr:ABC transporter substrate-binding protein [Bacillota bacterium]